MYGADGETLEEASLRSSANESGSLAVVEVGSGRRAACAGWPRRRHIPVRGGVGRTSPADKEQLFWQVSEIAPAREERRSAWGSAIYPGEEAGVQVALITPEKERRYARPYGGPPGNASRWALHHSLDILRRVGTGETE